MDYTHFIGRKLTQERSNKQIRVPPHEAFEGIDDPDESQEDGHELHPKVKLAAAAELPDLGDPVES